MGDPNKVKQVIVVRHDLKMRQGKAIAQGGHAVAELFWGRLESATGFPPIIWEWKRKWGQAKITARVDSLEQLQEVAAKAREAGLEVHEIIDSGLTEFDGVPTMTCISIGPDVSHKIDPITGHLKLM
jgi:PTH2 family peptidyl-tRNA hydrolase